MSVALKTIHDLPPAQTDVSRYLGLAVFIDGSLSQVGLGPRQLWQLLSGTSFGRRLARCRLAADAGWQAAEEAVDLAERRGRNANDELVFNGMVFAASDGASSPSLEIADRGAVLGMNRASHLLFRFPDAVSAEELASVAAWVLDHVPLWWGTAGWFFRVGKGPPPATGRRLAGLAKRYWGVQLLDTTALQWDALEGMPSVNWMNLIGQGFVDKVGASLPTLLAQATTLRQRAVFHRAGKHGVAFAAGARPSLGDINADERMDALVQVAGLLKPMLLGSLFPMTGPLAQPEVLSAWLHRFSRPQAWLDCDIHAE